VVCGVTRHAELNVSDSLLCGKNHVVYMYSSLSLIAAGGITAADSMFRARATPPCLAQGDNLVIEPEFALNLYQRRIPSLLPSICALQERMRAERDLPLVRR